MPKHLPALTGLAAVATSTTVVALITAFPAVAATAATPDATTASLAAPVVAAAPAASSFSPVAHIAPLSSAEGATAATALVDSVTKSVSAVPMPSARSASALKMAMSKLGKPYVWGATGPNAFDCSGLVSWAYKQVGVSLPRTSNAQSRVGQVVSRSQLRPGDLVFFYQPVSHVGIYLGDGKVVHASTSGQPVKISNVADMPFSGARRV